MYFSLEASMKNSVQLRHEKNFPDGLLVALAAQALEAQKA